MKPYSTWTRQALAWAVGLLAVALTLAFALFMHSRLTCEITELPDAEQRAIYERTHDTLRTTCLRAKGPELTEYCREQADLITRLPNCDDDCRNLAARFTPHPTR
jgi:hypothetical protein